MLHSISCGFCDIDKSCVPGRCGDFVKAKFNDTKTVFEDTKKRPLDKRKKERNDDPADIDGYLGPWAKYKDEELVSHPNDEEAAYLEEYLAKRKKRGKVENEVPLEENTMFKWCFEGSYTVKGPC